MGQCVTVEVLDSDGDPVGHALVKIDIEGIIKGGTLEEYTDDTGHAEFETAADYSDYTEVMIYVRGESFGPYHLNEGAFTVTLD